MTRNYDFEVASIKNIPLCRSIQEDVLLWPFNPNGEYSVKSGYRFLQEANTLQQPGPSNAETMKPLWNKIWGLEVPNKVKNLIWRACPNSLPTKVNLIHCKITSDSLCDICRVHQEDMVHALYCCLCWVPYCHAPNPIPGFVTMTGMLISSLNLILTRTNLTLSKTFTKAFLFLFILVSLLKWYNFPLDIQSIYIVSQRIIQSTDYSNSKFHIIHLLIL